MDATAYTYQGGWNDGQWANKHEFNAWGYNTKSPTYNYDPMYRSTEPYFTGHQFDGSLNIYYADHRFYDAETGTWLSPDPVKDGLNWYQYCGNNPATYVDLTGLFWDSYYQRMKGSVDFEFTKDDLKQAAELGFTKKEQLAVFGDIREYMKKNPDLKNGTSIFVFEGLGNYEGGINQYHPQGQFGAMIVVTRDTGITYVTPNASSLPDKKDSNILKEGTYIGVEWSHHGNYDAIQIRKLDKSDGLPGYEKKKEMTGVNIHAAGYLNPGSTWSEGCITMPVSDYIEFLGQTGAVDVEKYNISDPATLQYGQLNGIPDQLSQADDPLIVGSVVIDREHMPLHLKNYLNFQ